MSSPTDPGLLSPVWAGTAAATTCDDTAFVQAMLDVERAWVDVCVEAGLGAGGTEPDPSPWRADSYDLSALAERVPLGGNALIPLLADLRERLEGTAAATLVHRGATSQDVVDTALMLLAARALDEALPLLDAATSSLADLARRHRETPAIARTLGQHALPTTFGLRAAHWLDGLSEAKAHARRVRAALPLQWAGAAGTAAGVAALAGEDGTVTEADLRAALARRLGLQPTPGWHTDRLVVARLAAALAGIASAAGTFGTDVVTGSRREIGELAEPAAPGRGGSSAMAHKRNPVLSVLLRAAATSAPGHLATIQLAAGLAADERPDGPWHAEWASLRELLRLVGGLAPKVAELAAGLEVHPDALARNLDLWRADTGTTSAPDVGAAPGLVDELLARHRRRDTDPPTPTPNEET